MGKKFKLVNKSNFQPFQLDRLELEILSYNFLCETSVCMTFRNDTPTDAEGELGTKLNFNHQRIRIPSGRKSNRD